MQEFDRRQYEHDAEFGSVLLMVCAIGSRWIEHEPQVLNPNEGSGRNQHSAGWTYFQQVQRVPKLYSHSHSLAAMQCYAVSRQLILVSTLR